MNRLKICKEYYTSQAQMQRNFIQILNRLTLGIVKDIFSNVQWSYTWKHLLNILIVIRWCCCLFCLVFWHYFRRHIKASLINNKGINHLSIIVDSIIHFYFFSNPNQHHNFNYFLFISSPTQSISLFKHIIKRWGRNIDTKIKNGTEINVQWCLSLHHKLKIINKRNMCINVYDTEIVWCQNGIFTYIRYKCLSFHRTAINLLHINEWENHR